MIYRMIIVSFLAAAVMLSFPYMVDAADNAKPTPAQLTVLREGADNVATFSTIAGAVSAAKDAGADKPYTIIVNPGQYDEQVTLPPYVSISGVGKDAVSIKAGTAGGCSSESAPTLTVSHDSSVKNLSIENKNPEGCSIAIKTVGGPIDIENISAKADGTESYAISINGKQDSVIRIGKSSFQSSSSSSDSWGIAVHGNDIAELAIQDVTSTCESPASNYCGGIAIWEEIGEAKISDSRFNAKGGKFSYAMDIYAGNSLIKLNNVTAIAETKSKESLGARVGGDANVYINNSTFKATGKNSKGIYMVSKGKLTIKSSTVSGESLGLNQQTNLGIFELRDCTLVGGHNGFKGVDTIYNCRDGKGKLLDDF